LGATVGSTLLGLVGSASDNVTEGAVAGVVLGALMGYGAEAGTIGAVSVFAAVLAIGFVLLARGCDDYTGVAALPGAAIGAVIGRLWRGRRTG
jgi:hypothetical protein